ncbi:hypothetical protein GOP47_0027466 [Adiantum capillus-veneris]|nr:hypothetical protein GOP47_0027466 [Adiantum capillus-veneris]
MRECQHGGKSSPSQHSLTQEQRDRISKQKELALARRSAKAEALPALARSTPPPHTRMETSLSSHRSELQIVSTRAGLDSAYTNGPMSSFDADQQRKHDESVPDSGQSGDDGSDVLVASNESGEKKQWLWLPVKIKPTLQAGKNDDGSHKS